MTASGWLAERLVLAKEGLKLHVGFREVGQTRHREVEGRGGATGPLHETLVCNLPLSAAECLCIITAFGITKVTSFA